MTERITLAKVAEEAGVSRVAAGKVLLGSGAGSVRVSEEVAERIRRGARQLGYRPNRSAQRLKGKTGNLIGAIVATDAPEIERIRLVALERIAWQSGYQVLMSALPPQSGRQGAEACASALVNQGATGIIFLTAGIAVANHQQRSAFPARSVYCGIPPIIGDAPGVVMDLESGYQAAVGHFAKTGRRRIGVMTIEFASSRFLDVYSKYRWDAVRKKTDSLSGTEAVQCPIVIDPQHRTPSLDQSDAFAAGLLEKGVDAVIAYSDMAAARLIQVLHRRGVSVPDDVAVCGLNNLEIAELTTPLLTTIEEFPDKVAGGMLDLMLSQIEGNCDAQEQLVVKSELIIRESA